LLTFFSEPARLTIPVPARPAALARPPARPPTLAASALLLFHPPSRPPSLVAASIHPAAFTPAPARRRLLDLVLQAAVGTVSRRGRRAVVGTASWRGRRAAGAEAGIKGEGNLLLLLLGAAVILGEREGPLLSKVK